MVKLLTRAFGLGKAKIVKTEESVTVVPEKPKLLNQEWPTIDVVDITHDSARVIAYGGNGNGAWVYGRCTEGKSLSGIKYSSEPVFDGLDPETEYTFTAYKKNDDVYEHSRLAERVSIFTKPVVHVVEEAEYPAVPELVKVR